ncbi:MAG: monovalent cation/H(+) antiporter subunit G [Clostridia bacterium]|nr:monovalent cation/H(+) antiporter subunit G [Clostridia bacterium]
MILAWIRFGFTALFFGASVFFFLTAALGVNKRNSAFVLNRMHSAGIGDTLGLLFALCGVATATGLGWHLLKLLLLVAFMWITSPVSTHLLAETELFTTSHALETEDLVDPRDRLPDPASGRE